MTVCGEWRGSAHRQMESRRLYKPSDHSTAIITNSVVKVSMCWRNFRCYLGMFSTNANKEGIETASVSDSLQGLVSYPHIFPSIILC